MADRRVTWTVVGYGIAVPDEDHPAASVGQEIR